MQHLPQDSGLSADATAPHSHITVLHHPIAVALQHSTAGSLHSAPGLRSQTVVSEPPTLLLSF